MPDEVAGADSASPRTLRQRVAAMSPAAEFVTVLAIGFSYFIATSFVLLLSGQRTFDLTTGRAMRGIAVELVILAVIGWILTVRGRDPRTLPGSFTWKAALAGVPLAIGYYVLYVMIAFAAMLFLPASDAMQGVSFRPVGNLAVVLALIVLNSAFEEVLVTGYIVTALASRGAAVAVGTSVAVRLLYHLYHGPAALLGIVPLGVVFAVVYWRTKTLWPLLVAHTLVNLAAFASTSR